MLIIDRFENEYAVLETDNGFVNIPRADLPNTAREGDILILSINDTDTTARKKRINDKMKQLFKDEN